MVSQKMALHLMRGCYNSRQPSILSCLSKTEGVYRSSYNRINFAYSSRILSTVRPYSSGHSGRNVKHQKVVVVGIPNPFIWFRTRMYYFLIRAYFDKEFRIEEFKEGANQAFSNVSTLLSRCQFEAMDGLVSKDLIEKLEQKCKLLPPSNKKALSADTDDIMYTTLSDVGIYYEDNGRKFVSIVMRFWYLTSARLSEDTIEGARIFQVTLGDGAAETKRLLTANYEFQREFTKGVPPEWIVTRIEHSKLLE